VNVPRLATLADYRWLYENGYMPDGMKCAREILPDIIDRCPATFLDYGCGRGHLVNHINTKTSGKAWGYDPGLGRNMLSSEYDYVISCDVLEHIHESKIDRVLVEMRDLATYGFIFTIANMSDVHTVDGEKVELHLIQEDAGWWGERIRNVAHRSEMMIRPLGRDRFAIVVDFA
jgi:hypothetical protein